LRIGLLLDGVKLSRFFAMIIEDIQASNFAKIELLVLRKASEKPPEPRRSGVAKAARHLLNPEFRKHALYNQYLRLDEQKKTSNHPLEQVDCSHLLAGIERLEVEPIGKKFVHRFPPEALETIRAKNLDVLLRFGFNILKGDILKAARYGVWSYHHGDNDFFRGGPPHFWELCEEAPLSGVILQVLTEDLDAGLVLCKSLFATEQTVSVSRNRFPAYWGSTDLVIRKLMNWYASRDDYYTSPVVKGMHRNKNAERKRKRILSDDEIISLWKAADGTFGALLKVALLTAQRGDKVVTMRWDDTVDGVWTIQSSEREKSNAGSLQLPKAVLDIIAMEINTPVWLQHPTQFHETRSHHR
jgi:hypothetical protein